jgi:uncharacterized lipoprotein YajG
MKKLLLVFAIAAFVACNDSGTKEENATPEAPAPQAAPPADSAATSTVDSAQVDSSLQK